MDRLAIKKSLVVTILVPDTEPNQLHLNVNGDTQLGKLGAEILVILVFLAIIVVDIMYLRVLLANTGLILAIINALEKICTSVNLVITEV